MMICDTAQCFSCSLCSKICPSKAITMQPDKEGFPHPVISEESCINCGLCKKFCPANQIITESLTPIGNIYAFKHPNREQRALCASGGAYTYLAEKVLALGGTIYGAALSENLTKVYHIRAATEQELAPIQGSKYVLSDISSVYEQISQDLKDGKHVLFSGTACQVYALKNYLSLNHIDAERLLSCDVICHGSASPLIYESFIRYLQKKTKNQLQSFRFRDKAISWRGASSSATLCSGKKLCNTPLVASYMTIYYTDCITNDRCYTCPFATEKRISDITIGDFWGIEKVLPEFEDSLGVSVILANSDKGNAFVYNDDAMVALEINLSVLKQPNLHHPVKRPVERNTFWNSFERKSFSSVLHQYGGFGLKHNLRMYINAATRRLKK